MKLFLSPHNDDETLFGAFTILRERPTVCVVYDSCVQPARGPIGCDYRTRQDETASALRYLIGPSASLCFAGLRDDCEYSPEEIANAVRYRFRDVLRDIERVWAPAKEEHGHDHHNAVAEASELLFPGRVTHYLTYTRTGGKSRGGVEVQPRSGGDIACKLRALACYGSQLQMDPRLGCWQHFCNDLREYAL